VLVLLYALVARCINHDRTVHFPQLIILQFNLH
jgi:hypothetical protein